MSTALTKAFFEKASKDTDLQERLKTALEPNSIVAIAESVGYKISAEDIEKFMSDLTDKELEGAAGGVVHQSQNSKVNYNPTIIGPGSITVGGKIG